MKLGKLQKAVLRLLAIFSLLFQFHFVYAIQKLYHNELENYSKDLEIASVILDVNNIIFNNNYNNDNKCNNIYTYTIIQSDELDEWCNIHEEDFEGAFPNDWEIFSLGDVDAYWDDESHYSHWGDWGGWCADGGEDGISPNSGHYLNDMNAWMTYGPFDLSDATDAELTFYVNYETESNYDYFKYGIALNGINYYYYQVSGNSNGWVQLSIDFTDAPHFGNVCGEDQVWITFIFQSDATVNDYNGVYLDDIELNKYINQGEPPDEPDDITGEYYYNNGDDYILLAWDDCSNNEEGFRLERRQREEGGTWTNWSFRTNFAANQEGPYPDYSVAEGNYYQYRIRAENDFGVSDFVVSNSIYATGNEQGEPPDEPNNLLGEYYYNNADDYILLSWDDCSDNEDGFRLERRQREEGGTWTNWSFRTNFAVDQEGPYPDYNVAEGNYYQYRIRAENSFGVSGFVESNSIYATGNNELADLYAEYAWIGWRHNGVFTEVENYDNIEYDDNNNHDSLYMLLDYSNIGGEDAIGWEVKYGIDGELYETDNNWVRNALTNGQFFWGPFEEGEINYNEEHSMYWELDCYNEIEENNENNNIIEIGYSLPVGEGRSKNTNTIPENIEINIYPIPSNSNVNIEMYTNKEMIIDMKIYNIEGRMVREKKGMCITRYNSIISLSLDKLNTGIYYLVLKESGKMLKIQKIVLIK